MKEFIWIIQIKNPLKNYNFLEDFLVLGKCFFLIYCRYLDALDVEIKYAKIRFP